MENPKWRKEFVVDTNDHCFLCLDNIHPSQEECQSSRLLDNSEAEHSTSSPASPPPLKNYSIKYLSRYLGMDVIGNVFHDKDSIPSKLLAKVQRSDLKVTLCEKCAGWNSTMLEKCRQLEKIQMEVNSYLELMHGQLLRVDMRDKEGEVFGKTDDSIGFGPVNSKVEIARILRLEFKKKCSRKIRKKIPPRVKIQKLTSIEFLDAKLKSKCKSERCKANQVTSSSTPDGNCVERIQMDSFSTPIKVETGDDNEPPSMNDVNDDVNDDTLEGSHLNDLIWKEISTSLDSSSPGAEASSSQTTHSHEVSTATAQLKIQQTSFPKNKCSICQKTFANAKNCERHILEVHVGVKFRCQLCNKVFNSTSSLFYHKRTSCGIPAKQRPRPFRCPTCGKGYAEKTVLKMHIRLVHMKLGETKCKECGGTFSSPRSLKMHNKAVHLQIRDHGCDLCGMKFKRKDALQGHRRAKHKVID